MTILNQIDIRQGTENAHLYSNGNALPYTGVPFAMNYFAVQTNGENGSWWFHPRSKTFQGFRVTHQPSPWMGDFSWMLFTPYTGNPKLQDLFHVQSSYRPDEAIFKPHYNQVFSMRYRLKSELTASTYGMKLKLSSLKDNVGLTLSAEKGVAYQQIDAHTIQGTIFNYAGCEDKDFKMYFTLRADSEITKVEKINELVNLSFDTPTLELSFASSFISHEQALLNLDREKDLSFEDMKKQAESAWLNYLNRIEISHHNENERKTFYGNLYRVFLFPQKFYEIDKNDNKIHYDTLAKAVKPGVLYTNNGFWDTYKSVYPLFSLIAVEEYEEMMAGFLNSYRESGFLPKWLSPDERGLMPGTLVDAVIADAAVKGIATDLIPEFYEAMLFGANNESDNPNYGRRAVYDYLKLGYVPTDYPESVNQSLDNAYSDFCIAQVAKVMEDHKNVEFYMNQSQNYRKLFNEEYGFMIGRDKEGNFRTDFDQFNWGQDYTEGSAWQNSFAVYHDIHGLMSLHGGEKPFLDKLIELANTKPYFNVNSYNFEIHEMSEMAAVDFGQIAISNQPSFHLPYLYQFAGKPAYSQHVLRNLMKHAFNHRFEGYPGDEDNGSMSAWFIFSALGFYPVSPASGEYVVGIPLIDQAKVHLSNGQTLEINTYDNKEHFNFVDEIHFNGDNYENLYFKHEDLMKGPKIDFTLNFLPKQKEYSLEQRPFSVSKK
ncbi:MAG TPA: GH92 family glycosyl hydrolase [Erysipelothrix sp.]